MESENNLIGLDPPVEDRINQVTPIIALKINEMPKLPVLSPKVPSLVLNLTHDDSATKSDASIGISNRLSSSPSSVVDDQPMSPSDSMSIESSGLSDLDDRLSISTVRKLETPDKSEVVSESKVKQSIDSISSIVTNDHHSKNEDEAQILESLLQQIDTLRAAVLQQIKASNLKRGKDEERGNKVDEEIEVGERVSISHSNAQASSLIQAEEEKEDDDAPNESFSLPVVSFVHHSTTSPSLSTSLDNFEAELAKSLEIDVPSRSSLTLDLPNESSSLHPLRSDSNRSTSTPDVPGVVVAASQPSISDSYKVPTSNELLGEELESLLNSGASLEQVTERLAKELSPSSSSSPNRTAISPRLSGAYSSLPFFQSSYSYGVSKEIAPRAHSSHTTATVSFSSSSSQGSKPTTSLKNRVGTSSPLRPLTSPVTKPVFAFPSRGTLTLGSPDLKTDRSATKKLGLTSPSSSNQFTYPSPSKQRGKKTPGSQLETGDSLSSVQAMWDPVQHRIILTPVRE
jgi:hypothetical protein